MASEKRAATAIIGQRQRVGQAMTESALAIVVAVVVCPLGKAALDKVRSASVVGRGRSNATLRSGLMTSAAAMLAPRYTACIMRPDHHRPPSSAATMMVRSHQ